MSLPRSQQVCLDDTSYHHCVARYVRRAFLCSKDPFTRTSYEHRRNWPFKVPI
ncbi:hypothetical protein [Marinomonas primoryensis]|uniref:hypothetical protein n=1 Tax=Marinomonas primoryensis TaxID=178399 RepID=UPI003704A58E